MYSELGWESLEEQQKNQTLKVLHQCFNNVTPIYLQHEIPHPVEDISYNLWDLDKIAALRARTVAYDSTLLLRQFEIRTICVMKPGKQESWPRCCAILYDFIFSPSKALDKNVTKCPH